MENEDENKYHWKKFLRECLESLSCGIQKSACSHPDFGVLL